MRKNILMTLKEDSAFEAFVNHARAVVGQDVSREWLLEIWTGADGDANRALNHVLDSPSDKIRREGSYSSKNKTLKKSKTKTEARVWEEDFPEAFSAPPRSQPAPPPQPQSQSQQSMQQGSNFPQQNQQYPQQQSWMQQQPNQQLMPPQVAPNQSMQQQQLQQLFALKMALDNVVANPGMIQNPLVMKNLKDTMLHALEVPEATLILARQARKTEETTKAISHMQARVSTMLSDPKVSHNPQMLDSLNDQMNQLRLLTTNQLAEQQQLIQLSQSASPSQLLLLRPQPSRNDNSESEDLSTGDEMDLEWWEKKKAKKQSKSQRAEPQLSPVVSRNNPFRDDVEAKQKKTHTLPNLLPQMSSMPQQPIVIMQQPMTSQLIPQLPSGYMGYYPQVQQQWQHPY